MISRTSELFDPSIDHSPPNNDFVVMGIDDEDVPHHIINAAGTFNLSGGAGKGIIYVNQGIS